MNGRKTNSSRQGLLEEQEFACSPRKALSEAKQVPLNDPCEMTGITIFFAKWELNVLHVISISVSS